MDSKYARRFDINMIKDRLETTVDRLDSIKDELVPPSDLVDMLKLVGIIENQILIRFNHSSRD